MGSIYWRNLISLILAKKARKYPKTGASQAFLKITFSWKWTRLKFKWCASFLCTSHDLKNCYSQVILDQSNCKGLWSAIYQEERNLSFWFKMGKYPFQKKRNLDFVFRSGQVCPDIAGCALDYQMELRVLKIA